MFKMSAFGLKIKHKLASVLAIGQLYHQSATAPGSTMCVVCHSHKTIKTSQFLATF